MGIWLPETCRENIHEKELCVKLVIYIDYTEMHGQRNIKFRNTHFMINNFVFENRDFYELK